MNEPQDELSSRVPVLDGVAGPHQARRARDIRRVGVLALLLVVVISCLGWLGPRDTSTSDSADGVTVSVRHPRLTRSGADVAIEVHIVRDGAGPVRVELPASVMDEFGLETFVPEPSSESVRKDTLVMNYEDVPSGDVTLRILGRMPTRASIGRFTHPVRVMAGRPAWLEVTTRTWVLP